MIKVHTMEEKKETENKMKKKKTRSCLNNLYYVPTYISPYAHQQTLK